MVVFEILWIFWSISRFWSPVYQVIAFFWQNLLFLPEWACSCPNFRCRLLRIWSWIIFMSNFWGIISFVPLSGYSIVNALMIIPTKYILARSGPPLSNKSCCPPINDWIVLRIIAKHGKGYLAFYGIAEISSGWSNAVRNMILSAKLHKSMNISLWNPFSAPVQTNTIWVPS